MKTTTIRQLRNDTNTVLDWIAHGETVVVTKRRHPVARMLPPEPETPRSAPVPDFRARLKKRFPRGPMAVSAAEMLAEGRERY